MNKALLTIGETAELLSVSTKTVHRLIDNGKLRIIAVTNSRRGARVDPEDIQSFINENKKCQSRNEANRGKSQPTIEAGELERLLRPLGREKFSKPNLNQTSSVIRLHSHKSKRH
jgi:excisionase family DNA binding protein